MPLVAFMRLVPPCLAGARGWVSGCAVIQELPPPPAPPRPQTASGASAGSEVSRAEPASVVGVRSGGEEAGTFPSRLSGMSSAGFCAPRDSSRRLGKIPLNGGAETFRRGPRRGRCAAFRRLLEQHVPRYWR